MEGLGLSELGDGEEMRMGLKARLATAMLILANVPWSFGQTPDSEGTGRRPLLSSISLAAVEAPTDAATEAQTQARSGAEIFRELDDPNGGVRWLLSRDLSHPGGPGVLAPASGSPSQTQRSKTGGRPAEAVSAPIIRTGDRLVLEEHSAVVEARLEAVALGPAAVGSALRVRLIIGGKVVRARALAADRAVLEPDKESRP
jgi:hypothetical protein